MIGLHLGKIPLRHDAATVNARARTHVDNVVGGTHHVLIVFHHQHAVTQIAQMLQRVNQAVVIALVQPDAGFVQHVHHAR